MVFLLQAHESRGQFLKVLVGRFLETGIAGEAGSGLLSLRRALVVSIPAGHPQRRSTGWACSGLSCASAWPAIKHSFLPLDSPGFSSHPARTACLRQTLVPGFMCCGSGWEGHRGPCDWADHGRMDFSLPSGLQGCVEAFWEMSCHSCLQPFLSLLTISVLL